MPYLTNPIYLSGGFAGQTDAVAAFGQNFAQALTDLKALSPADLAAVRAQILAILNALPPDTQVQHLALIAKVEQAMAQKGLSGLGDPFSAIASIVSIGVSLASLGINVASMVQSRKQAKAAQGQADQANAANTALVNAQTELAQAQTKALQPPAGASAPGAAAQTSSSIPTLAASLVAGAGAFFLAR